VLAYLISEHAQQVQRIDLLAIHLEDGPVDLLSLLELPLDAAALPGPALAQPSSSLSALSQW